MKKNETPNPAEFMQLGEKAFEENVHEKLRETLSPNEKQMWISGYLLALTNFKQFQEQDNKLYSENDMKDYALKCISNYLFGNDFISDNLRIPIVENNNKQFEQFKNK